MGAAVAAEQLRVVDAKIKKIINIVVVIVVVIWLLQVFGLLGSLQGVRIR